MAVPKYIEDLQENMKVITAAVNSTEKAIVSIDTTLGITLPKIESGLTTLNGTVRKHETEIALEKQAHEECPARKAYSGGNPGAPGPRQVVIDLSDNKTKAAVGGAIGAPTLLILFEMGKMILQHYWGG